MALSVLKKLPLVSTLSDTAYPYLVSYAKSAILQSLQIGIRQGQLVIYDGLETYSFGGYPGPNSPNGSSVDAKIPPPVSIRVQRPEFWLRVYFDHDLGFAEAYMHGDFVATPAEVKAVLGIWIQNAEHLSQLHSLYNRGASFLSAVYIRLFGQSLANSKLSAVTGYDVCNDFFQAILSKDMTYSCAIFPESAGGINGDLTDSWKEDDLHVAQINKIHTLLKRARLRPGDRLLEFGSGWGQLAIEAAKMGCEVDTVTLSIYQKVLAEERIREAGFSDKIRVHLCDYRQLPKEFEGQFDAMISVEMVEAVGIKYLPQFFKIIDWALKKDRGAAVIVANTQPEYRFSLYQAEDYSRRYQWPYCFCPSPTYFVSVADQAKANLVVEAIENYAHHYPRTLREWARRLQTNWTPALQSALQRDQPSLYDADPEMLAIFRRKWEYMFVYAEIGFVRAYTGLHHFTFVRPENGVPGCD